jgi:hypothetical protein
LGLENRFVRELRAESLAAVEFLDGAAVETLGLGPIAQAELPAVGLIGYPEEAVDESAALGNRRPHRIRRSKAWSD